MEVFGQWLLTFLWEPFWNFFLNGFCVNLIRPLVVLIPLAIIFFQAGRGLGLPQLFRPESAKHKFYSLYDRFFIGIGVGILVWQAILAGYLFEEFATNYTFDRPPFCEWPSVEQVPAGAKEDAVQYRLPPGDVFSILWYAGALAVGVLVSAVILGIPFMLIRRLVMGIERKRNPEPPPADGRVDAEKVALRRMPSVVPLVIGMAVGLGLMGVVAWALLPGGKHPDWMAQADEGVRTRLSGPREWVRVTGEFAVNTAGYGRAAGRSERWRVYREQHAGTVRPDGTYDLEKRAEAIKVAKTAGNDAKGDAAKDFSLYHSVYGVFLIGVVLAFAVFVYLAIDPWHRLFKLGRPTFSPAAGLVFLLHLALFVQTIADYFLPVPQLVYLGLAVLTVLFARKYKLRHPNVLAEGQPLRGLQAHYEEVRQTYDRWMAEQAQQGQSLEAAKEASREQPSPVTAGEKENEKKPPLFNRDLGRWNDGTKKPLVLVCVSGGGSRSAAWTMKVLTELEQRIEKANSRWAFPYHIRIVSGASGGIIGASYYVSTLEKPDGNGRLPASRGTLLPQLNKTIREDFLTPIVHTMMTSDLWGLILPRFVWPQAMRDRGRAMEWAWEKFLCKVPVLRDQKAVDLPALAQTFDDLWQGEKDGWRPSLIFSPMMVEDGRQLLISNLDLLEIIHNRGESLDQTQKPGNLISREAVEFFRLFPKAKDFQVGTAARMSGSFPYVMPAVPLPTHPRRRVVDAGYYDNYGVGVAASWLFNNLEWVGENASKVAIVQIRDGLSTDDRLMTRPTDTEPDAFALGTEWLTTPPAGLYQSRVSSNMLRNDNLLHLLHDRMRQRFNGELPFVTPAFELPAGGDVSLSYCLTDAESTLIDACLPAKLPIGVDPVTLAICRLDQRMTAFVDWFTT